MRAFLIGIFLCWFNLPANAEQPNIVVIMTDDDDVSVFAEQPKPLALIADEGITFVNAYSATPVCAAGRASFLTGRYGHNNGVMGNSDGWGAYKNVQDKSMPAYLQEAGYKTALFGKFMNKHDPANDPLPAYWDHIEEGLSYFGGDVYINGALLSLSENTYMPDWLGQSAANWILARENEPEPFFVFYTPIVPHLTTGGLPPPVATRYENTSVAPFIPPPSFENTNPTYAATVWEGRIRADLAVGDQVENLINAVDQIGQLSNTVFIYTTDHGFCDGEHGVVGKGVPWECANRIYIAMRGPGIGAAVSDNHLVSQIDMLPTVCELAECYAHNYDGKSVMPIIGDPLTPWRSDLLFEQRHFYATRHQALKYTRMDDGTELLFHLGNDPFELHDKSNNWSSRLDKMQRKTDNLIGCKNNGCFE